MRNGGRNGGGTTVEGVSASCPLTAMMMKLKRDQMIKNTGFLLVNTTSTAMGSLPGRERERERERERGGRGRI